MLTLFSCKEGNNRTSIGSGQTNGPLEQKAFLVIPHESGDSILRQKLLHLNLASILKQSSNVKVDQGDEFKFTAGNFDLTKGESLQYETLKTSQAKVIVSFSDHTDIHFVPDGLLRAQAFIDLGLKEAEDLRFSWAPSTPEVFTKGSTYYLLGSSTKELLVNDQNFSFLKLERTKEVNRAYTFSRFQKIAIYFHADYFKKQTTYALIPAATRSCKREQIEDGSCDCRAKIERATGSFQKADWDQNSFGLSFLINRKEYQASDFQIQFSKEKQVMMVVVDFSQLDLPEDVSIQLAAPKVSAIKKTVSAFAYEGVCRQQTITEALDLTPTVDMSYQIDVYGRNLKL